MTTLDQYVRHAELYGTECVYETAEQTGLSDLPYLPPHLRRIDKNWRLNSEQRDRLLHRMIEGGVKYAAISEATGVPLRTVERTGSLLRKSEAKTRMVEPSNPAKSGVSGERDG
jgi:hypothetical protein